MFFAPKNSYCVNQLGRSKINIFGKFSGSFSIQEIFFLSLKEVREPGDRFRSFLCFIFGGGAENTSRGVAKILQGYIKMQDVTLYIQKLSCYLPTFSME